MELDPKTLWSAATGAIGAAVIGWIGIVRRIDSKVSRHEMHENLERRDTRLQSDLKEVLDTLKSQNETSAEYRALSADRLQKLSEDIAVLKDRAGRSRGTRS